MTNNVKIQLNTTLNALIAQRARWEDGIYKQANAELYAILEQCFDIFAQLKSDKQNLRAFNAIAQELNIKFTKGTSLALKIVRVVFGQQSNREHAYARVLKLAYIEKDDAQTLTNYIVERGGIENVRRETQSSTSTKLSADDYKDIAEAAFESAHSLATFSVEDHMISDEENDTDYVVALVRCDSKGKGEIVYGSNKRVLVNNALAVMGKELDDLQKQSSSKAELTDVKQQKAADIKQFVAQARTRVNTTKIN